jgi:hypothetical protein
MNANWELIDLIMETELKYADFMNLLLENDDVDQALADPVAVIAPALALGALLGKLLTLFGITVEEYNKRAEETGGKKIKVFAKEDTCPAQ